MNKSSTIPESASARISERPPAPPSAASVEAGRRSDAADIAPAPLSDRQFIGSNLPETTLRMIEIAARFEREACGRQYFSQDEWSFLRDWLFGVLPCGHELTTEAYAILRRMPDVYLQLLWHAFPWRIEAFGRAHEPSLFDGAGGG